MSEVTSSNILLCIQVRRDKEHWFTQLVIDSGYMEY